MRLAIKLSVSLLLVLKQSAISLIENKINALLEFIIMISFLRNRQTNVLRFDSTSPRSSIVLVFLKYTCFKPIYTRSSL